MILEENQANPEKQKEPLTRKRHSPLGYLLRFIGSWLGLTGLYAAFSVCPFCGQQSCPIGLASAGAVGAFLALFIQDWKTLLAYIRQSTIKKRRKTQHQPK